MEGLGLEEDVVVESLLDLEEVLHEVVDGVSAQVDTEWREQLCSWYDVLNQEMVFHVIIHFVLVEAIGAASVQVNQSNQNLVANDSLLSRVGCFQTLQHRDGNCTVHTN